MSTPFLGEIKIMAFSYAPKGWAQSNGQILPINQNQALFSLLGTTYGGNGQTNFALPNLQTRLPMHAGSGFSLGEVVGEINHTLTAPETPAHVHFINASPTAADSGAPTGNVLASAIAYAPAANLTVMHPGSLTNAGGSQSHANEQPYLVLNFCIALQGIFPSRS